MPTDLSLPGRLAASLRDHAEGVTVDDAPFDPGHRTTLAAVAPEVGGPAFRSANPRRPLWTAAAAVVAVAALGSAVWVATGDGDGSDTSLSAGSGPVAPDDALAPAWVPEGWEPARVWWAGDEDRSGMGLPGASSLLHLNTGVGDRTQLLGDPDDPERVVLVESGRVREPDDDRSNSSAFLGEPVTVRGRPGRLLTADQQRDFPAEVPYREGALHVAWEEDGLTRRADVRGMSATEALAALGSLAVDPGTAGGAPGYGPGSSGLAPVGDVEYDYDAGGPWPTTFVADYVPTDDVPVDIPAGQVVAENFPGRYLPPPDVLERTLAGEPTIAVSTTSADPAGSRDYLVTSFYGERDAAGVATLSDGPGVLRRVWPDGHHVAVAVMIGDADIVGWMALLDVPGVGPWRATAERVLDSVGPADPDQLTELLGHVNAMRRSWPETAAVDLPSGRVVLRHEEDGGPTALCLATGGEEVCEESMGGTGGGLHQGHIRVAGTWYVVAIASEDAPLVVTGEGDDRRVVDSETGTAAGWDALLAPMDIEEGVQVLEGVGAAIDSCAIYLEMVEETGVEEGWRARADDIRSRPVNVETLLDCLRLEDSAPDWMSQLEDR